MENDEEEEYLQEETFQTKMRTTWSIYLRLRVWLNKNLNKSLKVEKLHAMGNFSYQLPTDLPCELRKNWLSFLDEDLWTQRIPNHETDVKFDTVYVLV